MPDVADFIASDLVDAGELVAAAIGTGIALTWVVQGFGALLDVVLESVRSGM